MRPRRVLPLCTLALCGCVYFNTFYNAEKYYDEGEKLAARAPENAGLPASARTAFERSVEKSSQVLTSHPNSKYADDALLLLGKAHFWLGNYAESAAALRGLLESHPQSGLRREAAVWLVRAGAQSGDAATAERISGELLAQGDLSSSDRVALQLERAHLALEAGEPAAAVGIYEELERTDSERARREGVPLLRAEAHLAQGDTAAALGDLGPLVAAEDDPELQRKASVVMAGILASSGEPGQAIETYREVLSGDVGDSLAAEIHLALAETQRSAGNVRAAAEELATVARLVPSTPIAATSLYRRGLIEWRDLRSRDDAKKTLLEAFLQDPDAPAADSAAAAARTIQEIQHYQAILAGSEQVLSPLPPEEVKATATYLLAELLYTREGDAEGARKLFGDMLTLYPGSAWTPKVLYTLGWLVEHGEGTATDSVAVAAGDSAGPRPPSAGAEPERAAAFYRRVIEEYPRTEYAHYAREALADTAGATSRAPSVPSVAGAAVVAAADSSAAGTPTPGAVLPPEAGAGEPAGEGLLPLPDQAQVVEIAPAGAPAAAGVADPARVAAGSDVPTGIAAPAIGAAGAEGAAGVEGAATGAEAARNPGGAQQPAEAATPGEVTGETAAGQAPGEPAAEEAPGEVAPQQAPGEPDEFVDEKLMAYTLALPRAQDPLIGIEDRLLARRRAEAEDEGPSRRPIRGVAQGGLAPGSTTVAADSLTPAQIDSIARAGGPPAGAGPGDQSPGNVTGPGGTNPEDRK